MRHALLARIVASLAVLLPLSLAQGAGFDCTKAATPAEKRICADARLSELDGAMADAYAKAQAALPGPLKDILRHDQRDWIKSRDALVADPKRKADLVTLMQERIAALKPSRIGTLDFLLLHGQSRPPFLLSAVPGQDMFNLWARKQWSVSVPDEANKKSETSPNDPDEMHCSESFTYTVNLASPVLLGVGKSGSTYCEGTAHPTAEGEQFNWWLERNKPLVEQDMFKDKTWRKVVSNSAAAQMDPDRIMDRTAIDPALLSPANWQITAKSLHIVIPQDSVFPHVMGEQEADVPWEKLTKVLDPAFSAALQQARQ